MVDWPDAMDLGVLLYPGFDLLEVAGPLRAFGALKNVFEPRLVAAEAGAVASAQGPRLLADAPLEDDGPMDLLLVPGGVGARQAVEDDGLRSWLRARAEGARRVLSVGTGAVLLARAGLLEGRQATCSARGLGWAREQAPGVRWVAAARWVEDPPYVTAAGAASGLDMALRVITSLTAPDVGENVARSLEHPWIDDPAHDPFADV